MTKAPRWLDLKWKDEVPESLLTGTLEERAARILQLMKKTKTRERKPNLPPAPSTGTPAERALLTGTLKQRAKRVGKKTRELADNPILLKVLVLDLARAAAEQRKWLKPVEELLVAVLGLQAGHKAGGWYDFELERRGRKPEDIDAWFAAMVIDDFCFENYRKVLRQVDLQRKLQERGFNTKTASIREWRKDSYGVKRGTPGYVPPNAPTMTAEEARQVPPLAPHRGPSAS